MRCPTAFLGITDFRSVTILTGNIAETNSAQRSHYDSATHTVSLNFPFRKRQLTPRTAVPGRAVIDSSTGASFPWAADWTECTRGGILNDSVG